MLAATAITGKKPRKLTIVKNTKESGEKTKTTYTIERSNTAMDARTEKADGNSASKI